MGAVAGPVATLYVSYVAISSVQMGAGAIVSAEVHVENVILSKLPRVRCPSGTSDVLSQTSGGSGSSGGSRYKPGSTFGASLCFGDHDPVSIADWQIYRPQGR